MLYVRLIFRLLFYYLDIDNPIGREVYIVIEVLRKMSCCGGSNHHNGRGTVESDEMDFQENHITEGNSAHSHGGGMGCGRGYGFWILVAVFGGLILLRYFF